MNYYNEFDAFAAAWLRNLISNGLIADGFVDERSILEVEPADLVGFTQCHFFAGVGGWSAALRLAGVSNDARLWTGSPPCQPFSVAGKGKAQADERHLWPAFFRLIAECRPPVVFGEQVANAIGKGWLDGVFADLEGEDYACGALVLPACSVDAPHKRDRVWFVADAMQSGRTQGRPITGDGSPAWSSSACAMADADNAERRPEEPRQYVNDWQEAGRIEGDRDIAERVAVAMGDASRIPEREQDHEDHAIAGEGRSRSLSVGAGDRREYVGDADEPRLQGRIVHAERGDEQASGARGLGSFWSDHDWVVGADGKYRRVKPGLSLLAHGLPRGLVSCGSELSELARVAGLDGKSLAGAKSHRTGSLKGFGNAIVPYVAAEFIKAFLGVAHRLDSGVAIIETGAP